MKVKYSDYLELMDDKIESLRFLLDQHFEYTSILATDVSGSSYRVASRQKSISDYQFSERGFVVRVYQNGLYSEYSFNHFDVDDINGLALNIVDKLKKQLNMIKENSFVILTTPMINEEERQLFVEREVEKLPDEQGIDQIVNFLTNISDHGIKADKRIIECQAAVNMVHVNKAYFSKQKHLRQSYMFSEANIVALAKNDSDIKMAYKGYSGAIGAEIMDQMQNDVETVVKEAIALFDASPVEPGEYQVICTPEVAGLIAHEAFGHGVEMDMFVKERSLAKHYMGKQVASELVDMHDGALCAENTSSYSFDDEGVIASDTTIIDKGILVSGICDLLSALRLQHQPTGNGKRQSFERKAYTRMTNTIFSAKNDKLDDMVASIKFGYLLDGMQSGMEDPKNWGIQCILAKGHEIKDGKLTGKIIAPVIMTGYVPDLLKSIDMVGGEVAVFGSGYCGKGYKEYVKAADGGPYLRAKARLG
ncbi:MAG: TldD/PmbA family protein [Erysipelotrichaceae bacterium]|nr:TldD/PmbA family protein [Erysipelotrichaceae bacterium]